MGFCLRLELICTSIWRLSLYPPSNTVIPHVPFFWFYFSNVHPSFFFLPLFFCVTKGYHHHWINRLGRWSRFSILNIVHDHSLSLSFSLFFLQVFSLFHHEGIFIITLQPTSWLFFFGWKLAELKGWALIIALSLLITLLTPNPLSSSAWSPASPKKKNASYILSLPSFPQVPSGQSSSVDFVVVFYSVIFLL